MLKPSRYRVPVLSIAAIAILIAGRNIGRHVDTSVDWPQAHEPPPAVRSASPTPPPFGDFRADAVRSALQGAWTYEDALIVVEGDHIQIDHGLTAAEGGAHFGGRFIVTAPCGIHIELDDGDTKDVTFSLTADGARFAVENGVRHGDAYIMCIGNHVVIGDARSCTEWDRSGGDWLREDGACALSFDERGNGQLDLDGGKLDLAIDGDALVFAGGVGPAVHHPTVEAARHALAARARGTTSADGSDGRAAARE